MEPEEYQRTFELETSHWWFRTVRESLVSLCRELPLRPGASVLDAGCGTGRTLGLFEDGLGIRMYGFDAASVAARYWRAQGVTRACRGSIQAIPFSKCVFDAVFCLDVLECSEVSEDAACQELRRVLRFGGYAIVLVPAYRWLESPEHHRVVHAVRRYQISDLKVLLERAGFSVIRATHLLMTTLPAMAAYRFLRRSMRRPDGCQPKSDLTRLPWIVNEGLCRVLAWERKWCARRNLLWGSSLVVVARKDSE